MKTSALLSSVSQTLPVIERKSVGSVIKNHETFYGEEGAKNVERYLSDVGKLRQVESSSGDYLIISKPVNLPGQTPPDPNNTLGLLYGKIYPNNKSLIFSSRAKLTEGIYNGFKQIVLASKINYPR